MLNHKHLIINANVNKPFVGIKETEDFLTYLVGEIGMKIKIGPFAAYCEADGNNGITAAVCIETSHCSIHLWDKTDPPLLRMDVYSCAEFDVQKTLDIVKKQFDPTHIEYIVLDRNNRIKLIIDKD